MSKLTEKIQIIEYENTKEKFEHENIIVTSFKNPISFDNFDINIINLSSEEIWVTRHVNFENTLHTADFKNIREMIFDSKTSKIILVFPQNIEFSITTDKIKPRKLQYVSDKIHKNIEYIYPYIPDVGYEKNFKKINGKRFSADFYLKMCGATLIFSDKSEKPLAVIQNDRIISTTLKINNIDYLFDFLTEIGLINPKIKVPYWFNKINMFDDLNQKRLIEENTNKIHELETKNKEAQEKLDKNNEYKSILYKQSKPLENAVKSIIEELLDYDLSDFEDIGHEDFLIELDDVTFIGEIKGTKKNITNNHLSNLDVHFTRRQGKIKNENLQPILIANRFIERPIENREPVNHEQIKCAETKYKCLIIDSLELLKLFEKFKKGEIDTEEIKNRFNDEIGLFKL